MKRKDLNHICESDVDAGKFANDSVDSVFDEENDIKLTLIFI